MYQNRSKNIKKMLLNYNKRCNNKRTAVINFCNRRNSSKLPSKN